MAGTGLQPALVAILYLFSGLSGVVVAVRIWRKHVDRTLGGDDYLIVFAWILSLVNGILVHLYVLETYGGYHAQDVPLQLIDWKKADKLQYALGVEYNPVICVIKASFMWSLQRLRSRNVWIRRWLWIGQGINLAYMIAAVIATLIPCWPVAKRFNDAIPGHCYDSVTFVTANVTIAIVTDFLVLIIPTWIIYDLQMPLRKKLITISFLSLGFVVIAIGIARLVWLLNVFKGIINNHSVEQAYSAIESNVAIVGVSGPTIKYMLGICMPCFRGSYQKKQTSQYATGSSNHNHNLSRHQRSKYGDLDSDSIEREEIEMKNDWQWRKQDSDAHSDEQRITTDVNEGIVKTVDWTISTREEPVHARPMPRSSNPSDRSAVQPANVV